MTLQESANSSFVTGASGESLECTLNISGLHLVSCIISSSDSLEGNSYDLLVSNNGVQYHFLKSIAMQSNITTNSWTPENQPVFATPLSFNFLRVVLSGTEGISSSILLSGR
jgi:hypothetical protein